MGKYSSDDSIESNSRRRKTKHRSCSSSSSDSRYSRQKKSKKPKKSRRSRSRERSKQTKRDRSTSRTKRRNRSRSKSRSRSRRDKRSRSRDSCERRTRKSRSRSKKDDRGQDLMQKLNNAVVEVMNENAKRREESCFDKNSVREMLIDEINSPNFIPKAFNSGEKNEKKKEAKSAEKPESYRKELPKEEPGCLLHPNLLLDDHEEKLNRWVKKMYQIRQRSIHGDYLVLN